MPDENFLRTVHELETHPEKGTILVIGRDGQIVGYAVLINFWSNECGGNVLIIDELYVAPPCRGQGIGAVCPASDRQRMERSRRRATRGDALEYSSQTALRATGIRVAQKRDDATQAVVSRGPAS